ncbi:hypothetical protein E2C01_069043 [Portunus trituberculatus]|uniref:Uncharacterized protein n=1 Tax=Portunus trituberculatus TaxID=210409 RepID=A0A5B7HTL1_PORTR|nr:hypothetical protein [Portunus trituberculatus]
MWGIEIVKSVGINLLISRSWLGENRRGMEGRVGRWVSGWGCLSMTGGWEGAWLGEGGRVGAGVGGSGRVVGRGWSVMGGCETS